MEAAQTYEHFEDHVTAHQELLDKLINEGSIVRGFLGQSKNKEMVKSIMKIFEEYETGENTNCFLSNYPGDADEILRWVNAYYSILRYIVPNDESKADTSISNVIEYLANGHATYSTLCSVINEFRMEINFPMMYHIIVNYFVAVSNIYQNNHYSIITVSKGIVKLLNSQKDEFEYKTGLTLINKMTQDGYITYGTVSVEKLKQYGYLLKNADRLGPLYKKKFQKKLDANKSNSKH
jgi:competence protein ComGC